MCCYVIDCTSLPPDQLHQRASSSSCSLARSDLGKELSRIYDWPAIWGTYLDRPAWYSRRVLAICAPNYGPVDRAYVADVVGGAQEGWLVVDHPVVARLGVGEHGEGAAEDVGGEDDEKESVDYADDGHEVLRKERGQDNDRM